MFSKAHNVWRQHPWLRQSENLKKMFPGLGTASAIFGTYIFLEAFYNRAFAKKGAHAHGDVSSKTIATSESH